MNNTIAELQTLAVDFLCNHSLVVNGVVINLKEIEVYYYKEGTFEDGSVHRNELQRNNPCRFYVHRCGRGRSDSYKGGNYPGVDLVMSEDDSCYFTFLLRSVVIEKELVIGPHNVLCAILRAVGAKDYNALEQMPVRIVDCRAGETVLTSERINLGKTVSREYREAKLRFVILDGFYMSSRYPMKEKMITDWLLSVLQTNQQTMPEAILLAKEYLGHVPSSIKKLTDP